MTDSKQYLQRPVDDWPKPGVMPTMVLSFYATADELSRAAGLEFTRGLDSLSEVDYCNVEVDGVFFGLEFRSIYPEDGTHIYVDIRTPFRVDRARELVRLLGLPSDAIYWEENP